MQIRLSQQNNSQTLNHILKKNSNIQHQKQGQCYNHKLIKQMRKQWFVEIQ